MSNTIKLEVGQTIKNYPELCEILNVKPTKGKGREYHIKELERYCTYKKLGQKFIITSVKDTPDIKTDGRVNNGKNIYIDDMMMLLHDYITNIGREEIVSRKLLINLNLLHDDFYIYKNRISFMADKIGNKTNVNIDAKTIEDFYIITYQKMNSSLRNALNKLCKQNKIIYRDITYVIHAGEKEKCEATPRELEVIERNKKLVLNKLYEEEVIKKPEYNYVYTTIQHHKFDSLLDEYNFEDGINKVWTCIYVEIIEPFILVDDTRKDIINSLKSKFVAAIEDFMENIFYLKKEYRNMTGKTNSLCYNYPYHILYNEYGGWDMMHETVKYYFMLNKKRKNDYEELEENIPF